MKDLKCILFAFGMIFTSCEESLDLKPEQALITTAAFQDEKTSFASLIGVYSAAQGANIFGSLTAVISDFQSDNVRFVGSFPTLQQINLFTTLTDNTSIQAIWAQHYYAILSANAVIVNVPGVNDIGFIDSEKAQFVAEAKFLRALVYFNLVCLFGQPITVANGNTPGVPIVVEPGILQGKTPILPKRNTVADVYAQIEKDLTDALLNLSEKYANAEQTRGRATKGAANGLLCRINLYKGNWSKTIEYADAILNNKVLYTLSGDYSFFDNNTNEDIYTIQMSPIDNGGGWGQYYLPAVRGGRGDAPFSADLLAAFDQVNDKRITTLSFKGTDASGVSAIFTNKFKDGVTRSDNAPILRVTEIVLNKAEALVKATQTVHEEAIALINPLLIRAGLTPWKSSDFVDANSLLSKILTERRKELCFEGHRRMDLLRNGYPLRTLGAGKDISKPGDSKVVLPIPQRDIDLGSSGPQNAGY